MVYTCLLYTSAPLSGAEVEGYEIHMGESILKEKAGTVTRITDSVSGEKKEEGAFSGNVCGTYIHGIFDKEASAAVSYTHLDVYKRQRWREKKRSMRLNFLSGRNV